MAACARRIVHRQQRGISSSVLAVTLGASRHIPCPLASMVSWPGMACLTLNFAGPRPGPERRCPARTVDWSEGDVARRTGRIPHRVGPGQRTIRRQPARPERPPVRRSIPAKDRTNRHKTHRRQDRRQGEPAAPSGQRIGSAVIVELDPRPALLPGFPRHGVYTRARDQKTPHVPRRLINMRLIRLDIFQGQDGVNDHEQDKCD